MRTILKFFKSTISLIMGLILLIVMAYIGFVIIYIGGKWVLNLDIVQSFLIANKNLVAGFGITFLIMIILVLYANVFEN